MKLLPEPVIIGNVTLYEKHNTGYSMSLGGMGVPASGFSYSYLTYYISKGKKNSVKYLRTARTNSKWFKKFTSEYFKDCPKLIDKINTNHFGKNGIVDIVKFYNKNCKN